jgi:hypothetical protein
MLQDAGARHALIHLFVLTQRLRDTEFVDSPCLCASVFIKNVELNVLFDDGLV